MDLIPEVEKGKIFIFGNWKFPILEQLEIDLFWNSASFQEMEPDVVSNYLKYVNTQAKAVYLLETMKGKKIAKKKGDPGVIKKTTFQDYKNGLANFQLIDISPTNVGYAEQRKIFLPLLGKKMEKIKTLIKKTAYHPYSFRRYRPLLGGYQNSFWRHK